jgi:hypothetical protein
LLKLVCARSTAEVIGLPSNIFRNRHSSWNEHPADRILHHLIFSRREKVRLTLALEFSQGAPEEEIEHDQQ